MDFWSNFKIDIRLSKYGNVVINISLKVVFVKSLKLRTWIVKVNFKIERTCFLFNLVFFSPGYQIAYDTAKSKEDKHYFKKKTPFKQRFYLYQFYLTWRIFINSNLKWRDIYILLFIIIIIDYRIKMAYKSRFKMAVIHLI